MATFGFPVFLQTDKLPEFGYFVKSDTCGPWSFGQFYKRFGVLQIYSASAWRTGVWREFPCLRQVTGRIADQASFEYHRPFWPTTFR